jgi:PAS domain S-box-containing protein/putative nucleotidyltransferase with HDIG domain
MDPDLTPADRRDGKAAGKRPDRPKNLQKDRQAHSQPDQAVERANMREAFRHRPINVLSAACLLALAIAGVNLGILLGVRDPHLRSGLSDLIAPMVDLAASIALFLAARQTAVRSKRLAIAWGIIASAMFFFSLGGVAWFYLDTVLNIQPFPSIADGLYLAYYPVFLTGAFLLVEKPASAGELISRTLDTTIILASAILGFWIFLIAPLIGSAAGQSWLEQAILLAYPVGDLVLIGALILIIYNPIKDQENLPLFFLTGSLSVTIITDSVYSSQSLLGTYVSGSLLDNGWIVSSLLIGLAGVFQLAAMRSTADPRKASPWDGWLGRLRAINPYLPYVLLVVVMLALGPPGGETVPAPLGLFPLSLGVAGIVALVLVRQIIAISEINRLNVRLRKSMGQIQAQSAELEEANRRLQRDIAGRALAEMALQQSEALFRTLFDLSPDAILLVDPHDADVIWPIVDCNAAACRINGYTRDELIGHPIDMVNLTPGSPEYRGTYLQQIREAGVYRLVTQHRRKDGVAFFTEVTTTLITVGGRELIVGIDHDITDRKKKEDEIKGRLAELEAINKVSSILRAAQTLKEILPLLMDTTLDVIHAAQGSIWLYDPVREVLSPEVSRGYDERSGAQPLRAVAPGKGIVGRVFAGGQPIITNDFQQYPGLSGATRPLVPSGIGGAAIPIRAEEDVIGTLVVNVPLPRELTPDEIRLLTTLSEIAGIAIRRTSLRQQTDRRLRYLVSLSEINRTITSSVNLDLNLSLLLNQVIAQLDIDAADVMLFNPILGTLEYAAGSGFHNPAIERPRQSMGEGHVGRAAMERRIVHIQDLAGRDDDPLLKKALAGEGFVSYFAVPLLAKGQIKGVLETFHRVPREHDAEWLDFLKTLAEQAAIAVDNASLFEGLQRSNLELVMAYDATIEGWSRALDMRDKETEGHTQRVADLTVRLARTFDLAETELVQVRWGALLHDIGKMGVPDEILHKPGPLTDAEWVIMKRHPVLAFEMLSPIHYLRSALDIPYRHHEKWDGTGYPLGLKGAEIPLTARIFSVVDVWDALRSDRPYRSAWSADKVREYIRSSAGTHFDPRVVKVFLQFDVSESL